MSSPASLPSVSDLARMIDHSLLHPTMTDEQLRAGLAIARRCGCATACIKPYAVPLAAELLHDSETAVCAVVGFPHGNSHPEIIATEAGLAVVEGATEIDMVANAGKVLSGDWTWVTNAIRVVNNTCVGRGARLKVIFENDYLQPEHIIRLCTICTELGVAFVKTSSGYGFVKQANGDYNYRGATDDHLRLMREYSGPAVELKAAGGVRTLDDLLRVRTLGVTRIGATATESILAEAIKRGLPGPVPPGLAAGAAPGAPLPGY
jgi:deoxyribose-phosphate aldolase